MTTKIMNKKENFFTGKTLLAEARRVFFIGKDR